MSEAIYTYEEAVGSFLETLRVEHLDIVTSLAGLEGAYRRGAGLRIAGVTWLLAMAGVPQMRWAFRARYNSCSSSDSEFQ